MTFRPAFCRSELRIVIEPIDMLTELPLKAAPSSAESSPEVRSAERNFTGRRPPS
jgi:hypothetical protein